MGVPGLSFFLGVAILAYLSTFVLLAILRITTGISIQRFGFPFGVKNIVYTYKDGIRLEACSIGVSLHRPTFAQPTYFSLLLSDVRIIIDPKALSKNSRHSKENFSGNAEGPFFDGQDGCERESGSSLGGPERSGLWVRLTDLKERIKRLHRKVDWINMINVVATNTACVIPEVGIAQVGSFTAFVDTRQKKVDRKRFFSRGKSHSIDQRPAEWKFTVRNVVFATEGKEAVDVLDACSLNINGTLRPDIDGLRDATVSLKILRLEIPYDDIQKSIDLFKLQRSYQTSEAKTGHPDAFAHATPIETTWTPNRERSFVQKVSDSQEFVASILRGIQEIQFSVSFLAISRMVEDVQPHGSPVHFNVSMKEMGIDVARLEPKSPAHLMYFCPNDVAHQALIAAFSIACGLDDGQCCSERVLYIPMATTTVKTTLPSKTIEFSRENEIADGLNSNILFVNTVITSPALDFDPKHLPLISAVLRKRRKRTSSTGPQHGRQLISRLLPKATIKFVVQEPVIRFVLPPVHPSGETESTFDLLISTVSSISLDAESLHASGDDLHYSLSSTLRVAAQQLYYQTATGDRYNILLVDALDLKADLVASPNINVVLSGVVQSLAMSMVRPEISDGMHQISHHLRSDTSYDTVESDMAHGQSFLRLLPAWLLSFRFSGSDFSVEFAGVDKDVSPLTRGCTFELESWSAEYKAERDDKLSRHVARRNSISLSRLPQDTLSGSGPSPSRSKKKGNSTDNRRLALHAQGFEGFVIASTDRWEPESFLAFPRFEVAFTTSSDHQSLIFHVNSHLRALYCQISLYQAYALGVAATMLQRTFHQEHQRNSQPQPQPQHGQSEGLVKTALQSDQSQKSSIVVEITTIDLKVGFVQVKATMPDDPPLMIQINALTAGRHRWAAPFVGARLMRLYAEAPRVRSIWTRIVSIKNYRLDLRDHRRKHGTGFIEEKSIDLASDAIRIAVPHQLVPHKIFDNITNVVKTLAQLRHRFHTGTKEYILEKGPEGPKNVPKITIRAHALLFEVEDGPFEWKLGIIFRTGLIEQKQRLAREEAFKLKSKRLVGREYRRGSSRKRAQSAQPNSRAPDQSHDRHRKLHKTQQSKRSRSVESNRGRPHSTRGQESPRMRYDPRGRCSIGYTATTSVKDAWDRLQKLNAQSWKKRIDNMMQFQKHGIRDIRGTFWGHDEMPDDVESKETIMAVPERPSLVTMTMSDLNLVIDKPTFSLLETPAFLHRVGKGVPLDMQYSLLIPLHVTMNTGEVRMTLRDYPLPLLHIPAIKPGQSARTPSFSLKRTSS